MESTGSLGFDTGVSIKDKIIYIDSLWTALSINPKKAGYSALFGENAKSNECLIGWNSLSKHYIGGVFDYSLYRNTRYYIKIITLTGNLGITINENVIRQGINSYIVDLNLHLFTGTGTYDSDAPYYTYQKLYKCTIKDANDNYVRYFIPALDTVNRPCMYDTVTLTAFYNEGEGEFLYKIHIESKKRYCPSNKLFPLGGKTNTELPIGYIRCEYLQSTGTQYIDTGIVGDLDMGIDLVASNLIRKDTSKSEGIFGSRIKENVLSITTRAYIIGIGKSNNALFIDYHTSTNRIDWLNYDETDI